MSISEKKLSLIQRLMHVQNSTVLEQVEQLLGQAEMEQHANESIRDYENGDVETLEEFTRKNKAWLKKRYTE